MSFINSASSSAGSISPLSAVRSVVSPDFGGLVLAAKLSLLCICAFGVFGALEKPEPIAAAACFERAARLPGEAARTGAADPFFAAAEAFLGFSASAKPMHRVGACIDKPTL